MSHCEDTKWQICFIAEKRNQCVQEMASKLNIYIDDINCGSTRLPDIADNAPPVNSPGSSGF